MKTALICGVSGQDGAYLAKLLLEKGYRVVGTSRDAQVANFANLARLSITDHVEMESMALTDFRSTLQTIAKAKPDEVYNLAGQSSVALSFQQPVETMDSICVGTLNLLEAVRFLGSEIRVYNASSSECFGDTGAEAASEQTPFHPRSPYALAKAVAHWAVVNYREAYGLFAANGILFNHESPLRPERFVTKKIVCAACRIRAGRQKAVKLGNLAIQRDWGWAPEYIEAMWRIHHRQGKLRSNGRNRNRPRALFLQQRGDTLTAQEPYKRWWSVTYVELHEGEFTLTAPLSPNQWTSVFGQGGAEVPNEFNTAISQLANVGFTFGGTFAGHGVYVTGGNARFILKQYSLSQ